jgi:replication factor A1
MATAQQALSRMDAGSIAAIFDGGAGQVQQPVVQCVQIKPIASNPGGAERYRVIFSDSKNYIQTMLATAANHHITSGNMKTNCFVKLLGYQANNVKGKK